MFSTHAQWINRLGLVIIFVVAALIIASRFHLLPGLQPVATILYTWVLLLAAFALLLGIASVAWVHLGHIQGGEAEWGLSLILLIGLLGVFAIGILSPVGANSPLIEWVFDALIAPGQASLFALTGFFVVAAAYRYLRVDRPDAIWILVGALLALLIQTPLSQQLLPPIFTGLTDWLLVWPVMAALRGALLGGALAVLIVGLRLLARGGNPRP
ncbi:MAG: hypothetical protein KF893_09300 [Caldilineaceae bacterium]|nr:hypothetical protein [Caldilineaceae bacterium]